MIIEKESSFFFLVEQLNALLEKAYKFEIDTIKNNDGDVVFFRDSVINDDKIYLNPLHKYQKEYSTVGKWINRRLFTELLQDLSNGELMNIRTKLIRMQIGINMAIKLTPDKIEQEDWRQHIWDVCYKRFYAINMYYSRNICGLPF